MGVYQVGRYPDGRGLTNARTAYTPYIAATTLGMTLHGQRYEVGVRELHDRLSEHLERVEQGTEIMVTRRGQPIARLSGVDGEDPLDDLVRRGLITPPAHARTTPGTCAGARLGFRPRLRTAPLILYFDTSALVKLVVLEPRIGARRRVVGNAASSSFQRPLPSRGSRGACGGPSRQSGSAPRDTLKPALSSSRCRVSCFSSESTFHLLGKRVSLPRDANCVDMTPCILRARLRLTPPRSRLSLGMRISNAPRRSVDAPLLPRAKKYARVPWWQTRRRSGRAPRR
jgi:prevent-host-death family protein